MSDVIKVLKLRVVGWFHLRRETEILGWTGVLGVALERFKNLTIALGSWLSTKTETMLSQDDGKVVGNVVGGPKVSCSKVAGDGKVIGNVVGGPTLSHGKVVGDGKMGGSMVDGPELSHGIRSSVDGSKG